MPENQIPNEEKLLSLYLTAKTAENFKGFEPYLGEHGALTLERMLNRAKISKDPREEFRLMAGIMDQLRTVISYAIGKELRGEDNLDRKDKLTLYEQRGSDYLDAKLGVTRRE